MALSMLKVENLPNDYWAEVVNIAIYILNWYPTKAVYNMTPYEAWFKRKPQVDHLKVFCCIAYYHVPSQNREKFDEKGDKIIFIGYSNESKGSRLYFKPNSRELIWRDAVF